MTAKYKAKYDVRYKLVKDVECQMEACEWCDECKDGYGWVVMKKRVKKVNK